MPLSSCFWNNGYALNQLSAIPAKSSPKHRIPRTTAKLCSVPYAGDERNTFQFNLSLRQRTQLARERTVDRFGSGKVRYYNEDEQHLQGFLSTRNRRH
jgi:hypothetical protein